MKKILFITIFTSQAIIVLLPSCTDKIAKSHKLVKSAIIKLYQSKHIEALKDFTEAAEYEPENPEIWCCIGNGYMNLKDYQKAIEHYSIAMELKEDYANAYYNRGLIKFYMGEHNLAREDWKIAEIYGKKKYG